MIKTISILTFVFTTLCAVPVWSQSILGSQYPLGIPVQSGTGTSLSMGGTGIGVQNDIYGMAENPANLGLINRAVFSAQANVDFLNIFKSGTASNHVSVNPNLLSFCFPLKSFGSIGMSFSQRSSTDLKSLIDSTIMLNGKQTTLSLFNMIEGGSSSWQIGYGYHIKKLLSIGLVYERFYFNSNQNSAKVFNGDRADTSNITRSFSFATNGIRGGVQSSIKKLTLGFTGEYFFKNEITLDSSIFKTRKNSTLADSTITGVSSYKLSPPPSIGFGASYQITPEWLAAADFDAMLWEQYHSERKSGYTTNNAYSFSVGAQFIPAPNLLTPKYYEIVQYRAGFRYTQLPTPTSSEIALSVGVGLPVREGNGLIDFSFEVGNRSDSRFDKYNEQFFSIQFGFNAGQKWYQSGDKSY